MHPSRACHKEETPNMVKDIRYGRTVRKSYARLEEKVEMPNLV